MKRRRYAEIVLVLIGLIAAIPLHADITLKGPAIIIVPEDGLIHDFTYTWSNGNGFGDVLGFGLLQLTSPTDIGDPTDLPSYNFGFIDTATCSTSTLLADGASCTLVLQVSAPIGAPTGAGITDSDSNTIGVYLSVLYEEFLHPTGLPRPSDAFQQVSIIVTDQNPIVAVPEPSSLGLLLAVCTAVVAAHRRIA
jgi:hypothetical protein